MQVEYLVRYETFTVTDAEAELVKMLYNRDDKVMAIKFIRAQYSLGLKEAKNICDAVHETPWS